MKVSELEREINQVYLEMKRLGFTDIDHLKEKRDELRMKRLQVVAESGIVGNQSLRRMLAIKKNNVPIANEHRGEYELLSLVRKVRVQYFYDNNLVA